MARQGGYRRLVGLALGTLLWPVAGAAEVATDGTLGPRLRLAGPEVTIPARLGQTRGQNLFHSFARFGVEEGQRVTFTGPSGLRNVIGRVTGGEPSSIDGTLRSKVPGADLWLLNPAGILFGPDARLAVQGSFHASTADELRFADGAVFSARAPGGSVLSVAAPQAFGFLGARPAPITVDRSVLAVPQGQALSLIGGDVTITARNQGAASGSSAGMLQAVAGRITLAALGGSGAVAVATGRASGDVSGDIRLTDQALVDASGDGGGTVRIRGGRLAVENRSFIFADNHGPTDAAGGITIEAGGVTVAAGSKITGDAFGTGSAGTLTVLASTVELRDGAIGSTTTGAGDAGSVTVEVGHLLAAGGPSPFLAGLTSEAGEGATGRSGRVTVRADTIALRDRGVIATSTAGSGEAGPVTVEAGTIELRTGSTISSATAASGDAGEIAVTATGRLAVIGDVSPRSGTGISSDVGDGATGNAGRVTVRAGSLELRDTGLISSSTSGLGDAGEVAVTAAGHIAILGDVAAPYPAGITSQAGDGATGNAGRVTVRADSIEILDRAAISSSTFGPGNAGEVVVVTAGRLAVVGDDAAPYAAGITSQTFSGAGGPTGAGGRITVRAGSLELRDTGLISTSTGGAGDAGEIVVTAGSLNIVGAPSSSGTAGITSQAVDGATGDAGRVTVRADAITLLGMAGISSSTFGPGDAGEIAVTAGRLTVVGDDAALYPAGITSQAFPDSSGLAGAGGRVTVRAGSLELRDTGEISSSTGGAGKAGEVTVDAGTLEIDHTGQISSATFGPGDAGEVRVAAGRMIVANEGAVETNSDGAGQAGDVSVRAGRLTVRDGGLIGSSGTGSGPAGNVSIEADTLTVEDAGIRTAGAGSRGGTIAASASDLIGLEDAEVTASGITPKAGRSVITLAAPLIAVDRSRVTALTGTGAPLAGSGLVRLFGGTTVLSFDSLVAGSSGVSITGLESALGSRLVVPQGVFLNAGELLRASCAARRTAAASSFTAMGRGGLPRDPAAALPGAHARAAATGRAGPVLAARFAEGCRADGGG
ncbi:filamentous hemagglutinin N-terminal domain-containing protein [Benzoatithermus flavus]|uniref:Filamentous hemagglutinin N-terminal domain-containing protein n=1 Tax=Benzoatithermus flavus TaxID=3108223 RepID=A0ABU8XRS3_9PROT